MGYTGGMTRKKVMVNILHQGTTVANLETNVFAWMQERNKDYEFSIFFPSARPISNNRNQIVKDFLAGDWDYLFMIDDDNPPRRNPFDLLDEDKPVIAGIYPGRDNNGIHFHVYKFGKDFPKEISFVQYPISFRNGVKKVDAVGTGIVCIKRSVLERMVKKGWAPFEDMFNKDGTLITNDDMAFCIKCSKLKISIYAHFEHVASHYKQVDLLWIANLVAYAAQTGKTNFPNAKTS